MANCENCIHNAVCDMASRFVEAFADNNGICTDYKDKSLLIERKELCEKVEELLIGHGYTNPDTAILDCLKIIENFPVADVPLCNSGTVSTDCKDYPDCKGCPIDASGGCDK